MKAALRRKSVRYPKTPSKLKDVVGTTDLRQKRMSPKGLPLW